MKHPVTLGFALAAMSLIISCSKDDDGSNGNSEAGFITDISAIWTDSLDNTRSIFFSAPDTSQTPNRGKFTGDDSNGLSTLTPNLAGVLNKFDINFTVFLNNTVTITYTGKLTDTTQGHMRMRVLSAVDTLYLEK